MRTNQLLTFVALLTIVLVPAASAGKSFTIDAGDSTSIGIGHDDGLGGSVHAHRTGHSIQLHWTQGMTHCWVDIPVDGTTGDVGPHCVH